MGVGKTTVCTRLNRALPNSVFLDGDWCWNADPFVVTEETKSMVMQNICFLLDSFIRCSAYENIIFCWVMHEQVIIDEILARLDTRGCTVKAVSLVCSAAVLEKRLRLDIDAGKRGGDIIERSLARLPLYDGLDTLKLDTTEMTIEQIIDIMEKI